jgi:probable phosphoglycerate mutase
MTILVVRHGETDDNAARILQRASVPLNERGMRQAEQLARRLSTRGFAHIVCSDLLRARMTAAPLAARSGITIEESPLLQERSFGDLRGVAYAELSEDPFGPNFAPPNGEDWPTFHARVAEAFAFIVSHRMEHWSWSRMAWSVELWSSGTRWCPQASASRCISTTRA